MLRENNKSDTCKRSVGEPTQSERSVGEPTQSERRSVGEPTRSHHKASDEVSVNRHKASDEVAVIRHDHKASDEVSVNRTITRRATSVIPPSPGRGSVVPSTISLTMPVPEKVPKRIASAHTDTKPSNLSWTFGFAEVRPMYDHRCTGDKTPHVGQTRHREPDGFSTTRNGLGPSGPVRAPVAPHKFPTAHPLRWQGSASCDTDSGAAQGSNPMPKRPFPSWISQSSAAIADCSRCCCHT